MKILSKSFFLFYQNLRIFYQVIWKFYLKKLKIYQTLCIFYQKKLSKNIKHSENFIKIYIFFTKFNIKNIKKQCFFYQTQKLF